MIMKNNLNNNRDVPYDVSFQYDEIKCWSLFRNIEGFPTVFNNQSLASLLQRAANNPQSSDVLEYYFL